MSYSVLIVDDSPAMRSFIRRVIEMAGMPVAAFWEAGDGAEALERLRERPPDIVLTDINMPRMNGEDLVAAVEADTHLRSIPVVVISTDSTENRKARLMSLGARGYVKKPFTPETIRAEFERLLVSTGEACHEH